MGKLTDLKVKNAKPGFHGDGDGLYLRVTKPSPKRARSAKNWVLRVQHGGKRTDIGLGGYPVVDLATARDKARELRSAAKSGQNARAVRDYQPPRVYTFAEAMAETHAEKTKGMSEKARKAFKSTLEAYAVPSIGDLPVDQIGPADVRAVLAPIWIVKPELARKVDDRVRKVLEFAEVSGWRKDPAPTRRQLKAGLPAQPRGGHFEAMPYVDVPGFIAAQLARDEVAGRLALLFAIFTAARSQEVRLAKWDQIDEAARTWSRPAEIMKNREPHVVTLNDAAIYILRRVKALKQRDGLIFPPARGEALSDMTLSAVLRRAKVNATVHGFRSSFRDWAADQTNFPREIAEEAIAHKTGDQTERAYRRTDYREKRRPLLEAWGRFVAPSLSSDPTNVIPISGAAVAA